MLGLVSNLLQVPAELETAIETALGGHLQDVVVETFRDAEAAIAFLKRQGAGRATFLPLDSLRTSGSSNPGRNVLDTSGVRGVATTLVEYKATYNVVYEQLLGRVLVVEDLQVARQILADLPNGWTVVTLSGETVRSNGSVTGGASGKTTEQAGGMLMRERELRELPLGIAKLEKLIENERVAHNIERDNLAAILQRLTSIERESQQTNRQQQNIREKLAQLKAQTNRQTDEMKLRQENHQNVVRERVELDGRELELKQQVDLTEQARSTAQARIKDLERELRTAQATENDEREQLAALKTAQALSEQRLRNAEANLKSGPQRTRTAARTIASAAGPVSQSGKTGERATHGFADGSGRTCSTRG